MQSFIINDICADFLQIWFSLDVRIQVCIIFIVIVLFIVFVWCALDDWKWKQYIRHSIKELKKKSKDISKDAETKIEE